LPTNLQHLKQFSGYLEVNPGRFIHYWYVARTQTDPCSSAHCAAVRKFVYQLPLLSNATVADEAT
jgi:hypothetical protein